jgi:hypothetical protein
VLELCEDMGLVHPDSVDTTAAARQVPGDLSE